MTCSHDDVIALALTQVGKAEVPRGSNGGPDIEPYTGGRREPYCAHFVAWLFRQCGKPLPDDIVPSPKQHNPLASVSHMERVFNDHDWIYREPAPGRVVFYKTRGKSDRGPGRHVGLVVSTAVDTFDTVEGNWSDKVVRRTVRRNDPSISGFGERP
jgi:cell wall-associated NlpC family hydrolase